MLFITYKVLCLFYLVCFREERDKTDDTKIVAVDLQAMAPIPGVIQIQGDITKVRY